MARMETLTCSECGVEQTAASTDAKAWKGWRVLLDFKGQYPPKGYLCPSCYKAKK